MGEHRGVYLITGANSGIGKATALGLAKQGARVIMVCRHARRGETARAQIMQASGSEAVDLLVADLSSQRAIHQLSETIYARYPRLDALINNAGAMYNRRALTADGIERTLAVNHLAYFMLAHLLLDLLKKSAPARIVNVASGAAFEGTIDFNDLMGERSYTRRSAYAQSKLANILFTYAMARYTSGSGVSVNCLHPGNVLSNLGGPGRRIWLLAKSLLSPASFAALEVKQAAQAAEDVIYLVTSPDVETVSGAYFVGNQTETSPPESYDEMITQQLWQISAELTQMDVGTLQPGQRAPDYHQT